MNWWAAWKGQQPKFKANLKISSQIWDFQLAESYFSKHLSVESGTENHALTAQNGVTKISFYFKREHLETELWKTELPEKQKSLHTRIVHLIFATFCMILELGDDNSLFIM